MLDPDLLQRIRVHLAAYPRTNYRPFVLARIDPYRMRCHLIRLLCSGELDAQMTYSDRLELTVRGLTPYGLLTMEAVKARSGRPPSAKRATPRPRSGKLSALLAQWMHPFEHRADPMKGQDSASGT